MVLNRDADVTAESLAEFDRRDAAAWHDLVAQWRELGPILVDALMAPFPPVRAGARLARKLKVHGALDSGPLRAALRRAPTDASASPGTAGRC